MNNDLNNATLSAQRIKVKNKTAYIGRAESDGKVIVETSAQNTYYKAISTAKAMLSLHIKDLQKQSECNVSFEADYDACIEVTNGDVFMFNFESLGRKLEYNILKENFKGTDLDAFCQMLKKYFCILSEPIVFSSKDAYEKAKSIAFENIGKNTHFIIENGEVIPTNWKDPLA